MKGKIMSKITNSNIAVVAGAAIVALTAGRFVKKQLKNDKAKK